MRSAPHVLIGASAGLAAAHLSNLPEGATWLMTSAAVVASVLPDVDQYWAPEQKPERSTWLSMCTEHRGPTHSLLALALIFAVALNFGVPLFVTRGFAIGYLSHLVADWLNYQGVPWLWPAPHRFRMLPYGFRFPSGSLVELPIGLLALVLALDWSGVYVFSFLPF